MPRQRGEALEYVANRNACPSTADHSGACAIMNRRLSNTMLQLECSGQAFILLPVQHYIEGQSNLKWKIASGYVP